MLRLDIRRTYRTVRFADGEILQAGQCFGMLHLDNERVGRLHHAPSPMAVGIRFRRELLESLHALALLTRVDGPLAGINAFAAITILHGSLMRLGFELDRDRLAWPSLTGAYQRALLASLHPWGVRRVIRLAHCEAERLWMSRRRLQALYGTVDRSAA